MQPTEEILVLERLLDEGVYVLFERQFNANADGSIGSRFIGGAFVGGLHESRPAAGDDVAIHFRQCRGHPFDLVINERARLGPRRTEDGDAIAVALRGLQTCGVVDYLPRMKIVLTSRSLTAPSSARLMSAF